MKFLQMSWVHFPVLQKKRMNKMFLLCVFCWGGGYEGLNLGTLD